ncbi:alginate export family protein [candidate division KSB1 bacterium]
MKKLLTVLVVVLTAGSLFAQDIKFDALVRYRSEMAKNKSGMNTANFTDDLSGNSFSLMRSRLGVSLMGRNNISAYLQVQDSRMFGEEATTTDASADFFDLHQGYVLIEDFFADNNSLKIGRMELPMGNERLVGAFNWGNTGRAFDGAMFTREAEKVKFSVFGTRLSEEDPYDTFDPDEDFYGLFATFVPNSTRYLNTFGFFNYDNDRMFMGPDKDKSKLLRFTTGIDYVVSTQDVKYEVEFAYQTGKQMVNVLAERNKINALMYGGNLKYSFPQQKGSFIGLGYYTFSGDDNGSDNETNVFNTLYATNHGKYGFMDYFTNIPVHTSGLGLRDFYLSGGKTFNDEVSLLADWHYFMSDKESVMGNSSFGNEIDLTLKVKYRDDVNFQFGGSMFFLGDIPEENPNFDKGGMWCYAMMVYNFQAN